MHETGIVAQNAARTFLAPVLGEVEEAIGRAASADINPYSGLFGSAQPFFEHLYRRVIREDDRSADHLGAKGLIERLTSQDRFDCPGIQRRGCHLDALTQEDLPLAIKGEGGEADWVQLSRKHVIEVNESSRHMSILGGKLTDCLNVGDEVADRVQRLGIDVPQPDNLWYGEPGAELRDEFMLQARLMELDDLTDPSSSEPLSERFWRELVEYLVSNYDGAGGHMMTDDKHAAAKQKYKLKLLRQEELNIY